MRTVAVYSAKGGCGKSALTVFLAEILAIKANKQRVLVIDLDPQRHSSIALLGQARADEAARSRRTVDSLLREMQSTRGMDAMRAREHLTIRQPPKALPKSSLGELAVIPSDREGWFTLDLELIRSDFLPRRTIEPPQGIRPQVQPSIHPMAIHTGEPRYLCALSRALHFLADLFDVCFIDLPSHARSPLVLCGARAADCWLFPVQPTRHGFMDLDSTRTTLRKAFPGREQPHPLGTILTLWNNRNETEYKVARAALLDTARRGCIPPLFDSDCEVGDSTDAKRALNETLPVMTFRQKFGDPTGSFCKSVKHLAKELLKRLAAPTAGKLDLTSEVNLATTAMWARAAK